MLHFLYNNNTAALFFCIIYIQVHYNFALLHKNGENFLGFCNFLFESNSSFEFGDAIIKIDNLRNVYGRKLRAGTATVTKVITESKIYDTVV